MHRAVPINCDLVVVVRLLLTAQGVLCIIVAIMYFGSHVVMGMAVDVGDLAPPILMGGNAAGLLLAAWNVPRVSR